MPNIAVPLSDGWRLRPGPARRRRSGGPRDRRHRARLRAHRSARARPDPRPVRRHERARPGVDRRVRLGLRVWLRGDPSDARTGADRAQVRGARHTRHGHGQRHRDGRDGQHAPPLPLRRHQPRPARIERARDRVPLRHGLLRGGRDCRGHLAVRIVRTSVQLPAKDGLQLGMGLGAVADDGRGVAAGMVDRVELRAPQRHPTADRRRHRRRRSAGRRCRHRGGSTRLGCTASADACATPPASRSPALSRRSSSARPGSSSRPARSNCGGPTRTGRNPCTSWRSSCCAPTGSCTTRSVNAWGSARSSSTRRPTPPGRRSRSSSTVARSSSAA